MSHLILILDDELHYAQMLADLLQQEGYETVCSSDPHAAIELLQHQPVALVVTDYKMPEMDGAEFLRNLRTGRPDLPVIMISGFMNTPELLKVANIGVTLALEKPLDTAQFLSSVGQFVRRRRAAARPHSPSHLSTIFLVSTSPAAQAFLRALHRYFSDHRHLFVAVPEGSETALLANEIASWTAAGEEAMVNLHLSNLDSHQNEVLLRGMAAREQLSSLVVVDCSALTFAEQLLRIMRFVPSWREQDSAGKLTFLYLLHTQQSDEPARQDEDWPDFFAGRVLHFPPLAERPVDIAQYAKRLLASLGPLPAPLHPSLSPQAANLLFHHSWPGNYHELETVLKAGLAASSNGRIEENHLRTAIRRYGHPPPAASPNLLADLLRDRQNQILERLLRRSSGRLVALNTLLGPEIARMDTRKPLHQQALLFPDLLSPGPSA